MVRTSADSRILTKGSGRSVSAALREKRRREDF
jgi:hypothetical protein